MAVGTVQLYNDGIRTIISEALSGAYAWDEAAGDKFAFALATSGYTPSDAHTTINDVQLGNIITAGDGAPIAVPTRSITMSSGATRFLAGDADFGDTVTVPSCKYLLIVAGDFSGGYTLLTSHRLVAWCNLDTSGGTVASTASDFKVTAPANNIWIQITAQT